jgi:hypothetical protein
VKVAAPFASIVLATCLRCFGLDPRAAITQYAHIPWRVGERGLEAPPQSIAQTKDGYIWVGTRRQLYRFDGIQFIPLPDPETNIPHVQDTRSLLRQVMELYTSAQGLTASFAGRTGGCNRLVTIKPIPAPSLKIPQGLSGLRPGDTTTITRYVKSLILRSTVLMRLSMAFMAPLPASCSSREVEAG